MNGNEVRSQINELERVRAQTRLWRTLASLALLVIVLGGIGTIVSSVRKKHNSHTPTSWRVAVVLLLPKRFRAAAQVLM